MVQALLPRKTTSKRSGKGSTPLHLPLPSPQVRRPTRAFATASGAGTDAASASDHVGIKETQTLVLNCVEWPGAAFYPE